MFPLCRNKLRQGASCTAFAAATLLAACGGGGGGETASTAAAATSVPAASLPSSTTLLPSSSLANICTIPGQQRFVRSYLDEVYLWYDEIPPVNPADHTSVTAYFNALLVRTPNANGHPKDEFSAVLTTPRADALLASALQANAAPTLLSVAGPAVPLSKVVNSGGGRKVGYVQFNDHDPDAQDPLVAAFEALRNEGVQDLVLDMRLNKGGFLYVALTAASMVVSPLAEGRVFEKLRYNGKRQAESDASAFLFSSILQVSGARYQRGHPLPQLALPRLYVLASAQTCSASESIVNSLRGIDVEVILIGNTTCGKPYGFRRKDNCGWAFFPVEFQGYNAKGFGDYTAGFPPTCRVAEKSGSAPGSTDDPLLAAALHHADSGSCPATTAVASGLLSQSLGDTAPASAGVAPRPLWGGRLLQSPGQ